MEDSINRASASTWPEEALGRVQLHLAYLYRRHGVDLEEADMLEAKAMGTLEKYRAFVSDWVSACEEPLLIFDDLQPTSEGRYVRTVLLEVLWGRREGQKTATIPCDLGQEEFTQTGL